MSWIKTITYQAADKRLKRMYDRIVGPSGNIDNVLSIHSLRPHTLIGHMTLYKNVLHNSNNTLPKWYLECLGVYVSYLNHCDYCVKHHFAGLKKLLNDETRSTTFLQAVKTDQLASFFTPQYGLGASYAKKLTTAHHLIREKDIARLRESGFSEGEILEINQVVSYFNYVNRTVVGLGVTISGEVLGLSPSNSNDPDNWSHE